MGQRLAALLVLLCATAVAEPASAAPPPNDDFAAAIQVPDGESVSGGTWEADKEPGEPAHAGDPGGASVWLSWTAPRSEHVLLQICTHEWTGLAAVYRGSSVSALEPIASTASKPSQSCPEVRFRAVATTTYRIAVDGYSDGGAAEVGRGEYWLRVSGYSYWTMENDFFASPTVLESKAPVYVLGSTEGATREAGEPGHGGDLAGASVWYRWTAPVSGTMQLFPCRGDFDPVISVYTGSQLEALSPTGTPAPPGSSILLCQLGGQWGLGFEARAGTTYSISVDSPGDRWGQFQLTLQQAPVPYVDLLPPATYIRKRVRVRAGRATLAFFANERDATFLCQRDRRPYAPCASPKAYAGLSPGRHRFSVKAVDPAGNVDPTAAVRHFRVRRSGR